MSALTQPARCVVSFVSVGNLASVDNSCLGSHSGSELESAPPSLMTEPEEEGGKRPLLSVDARKTDALVHRTLVRLSGDNRRASKDLLEKRPSLSSSSSWRVRVSLLLSLCLCVSRPAAFDPPCIAEKSRSGTDGAKRC